MDLTGGFMKFFLSFVFMFAVTLPSFASDAWACSKFKKDDSLRFKATCKDSQITFSSIRLLHEGEYLRLGPVQGGPAKLLCEQLGLSYVSYDEQGFIFPHKLAIVFSRENNQLKVDSVVKNHDEYAAYFGLDKVVCK